jgi:hypothetical protein
MGQERTITNPVVVILNQVLSEMESLVLDPRVIMKKVKSFWIRKKSKSKGNLGNKRSIIN